MAQMETEQAHTEMSVWPLHVTINSIKSQIIQRQNVRLYDKLEVSADSYALKYFVCYTWQYFESHEFNILLLSFI